MITFDAGNGDWYVSLSSASGFWTPTLWSHGNGVGTTDQLVADFNDDGKADTGVYIASNDSWYVALSTGSGFVSPTQWSYGHGLSSNQGLAGDVNGDGDGGADATYFFSGPGHWDVGISASTGFFAPTAWAEGQAIGTTERFLADVNGDHRADLITFDDGSGDWYVSTSSGSGDVSYSTVHNYVARARLAWTAWTPSTTCRPAGSPDRWSPALRAASA